MAAQTILHISLYMMLYETIMVLNLLITTMMGITETAPSWIESSQTPIDTSIRRAQVSCMLCMLAAILSMSVDICVIALQQRINTSNCVTKTKMIYSRRFIIYSIAQKKCLVKDKADQSAPKHSD